jgi:hypothetical protein
MTDPRQGSCVAPGCDAETPSRWHLLCAACERRVEEVQADYRTALLDAMTTERAEAEAWLAAEWAPSRRWVIAGDDYAVTPADDVVGRMVEETAAEYGPPSLGFFDEVAYETMERLRAEHRPDAKTREKAAWVVTDESETTKAWRAHLAPLIRAALEHALSTFPLKHAGREIKNALIQVGGYGAGAADGAFEELWEGSGETGLSDDAQSYLEARYSPTETWCIGSDPEGLTFGLWMRHRVLPEPIMEIMDAAQAAHERRTAED